MRVEIVDRLTPNGQLFYEWTLNDGPEGIEEVHGYAVDLITAFSKVLEWHERIDRDYADELAAELDAAKQFLSNNDAN